MYRIDNKPQQPRSHFNGLTLPIVSGVATLAVLAGALLAPTTAVQASGGSSTQPVSATTTSNVTPVTTPTVGGQRIDSVKVSKAYTNATATVGGDLLIKAASSDVSARLFAYRPDGSLIGEVQNGGGSRYGGTVMPYQFYDPMTVTITSSLGGSVSVPTTPFQI